jgi:hypothetical protein
LNTKAVNLRINMSKLECRSLADFSHIYTAFTRTVTIKNWKVI